MSGVGRGLPVYIKGTSGNLVNVTDGNALKTDDSYRHFFPLGLIRVGNVNYVQLPNAPCSKVRVRNPEGNGKVYVGGSAGAYLATAGLNDFLMETEVMEFKISNANELSFIADNINTDIFVSIFTNNDIAPIVANPGPPDFTPPTISSTSPTTGATTVQLNASLFILFSEELDNASLTSTNITVSPSISYTIAKDSVNPAKVLILPSANLATSTVYTITAKTGLRDLAGNLLAAQSSFSFTTSATAPGADTTPPTVVSTVPANNAVDIAVSVQPTISFSEGVLSSTVNTTNIKAFADVTNTPLTIANVVLSGDKKTATLTLSGLTYSTKYRIEISSISDLSGNLLAAKYTTYFTTAAQQIATLYQATGATQISLYSGSYTRVLEYVLNNQSKIYNKQLTKYTTNLAKGGFFGGPTGNINLIILDATDTKIYTFANPISASSLTTTLKQYTFTDAANVIKMQVGYKIGIEYTGGDSLDTVVTTYASATIVDGTTSNNSYLRLTAGSNVDYTDSGVAAIIQGF